MGALYLNEAEVRQLLDMSQAMAAVEAAHRYHASGLAQDTPRQRSRTPKSALHLLQGAVAPAGVMGFKSYTTSREGARFWVHLFHIESGRPLAVLEADYLGMMRTGAAAGVATRCLARPEARCAGVFGAGWQAEGQIRALCAVRELEHIKVFARNRDKLQAFCERMARETGRRIEAAASPQATVEGSDIVTTITTASTPLFDGAWLPPGCHVNGAGSNALIRREIDEVTLRRADVVCVDSRAVALKESGDLLPALEKGRLAENQLLELGELLCGHRVGRQDAAQISLFESQGMAIQDLVVAADVVERARQRGLGSTLPY